MKVIVALIGKAGAGKDTILNHICANYPEYNKIVSCTTRPIRDNERDGEDYHFITNEDFIQKVLNGDMLEATEFNGWHYGTMKSSLIDGINIGVFNPEGFDCLTQIPIKDVHVIGFYIKCDDKERLLRQLNREQKPNVKEIIRRYSTDEMDFAELDEQKVPHITELDNSIEEMLDWNVAAIPLIVYGEISKPQRVVKIVKA